MRRTNRVCGRGAWENTNTLSRASARPWGSPNHNYEDRITLSRAAWCIRSFCLCCRRGSSPSFRSSRVPWHCVFRIDPYPLQIEYRNPGDRIPRFQSCRRIHPRRSRLPCKPMMFWESVYTITRCPNAWISLSAHNKVCNSSFVEDVCSNRLTFTRGLSESNGSPRSDTAR